MKACEVGNVTLFEKLTLSIYDIYAVCNHGRNALYLRHQIFEYFYHKEFDQQRYQCQRKR